MVHSTLIPHRRFFAGLLIGVTVGLGAVIGMLLTFGVQSGPVLQLPETALSATATDSGKTFAICTGAVDDGMEGLFTLDFLTGELQCAVLNHRTGKFNALFRTNVIKDLGIDARQKNPQYLLVSGLANFTRGASVSRPGNSATYVVDANTGRFAAYVVPWQRGFASAGRPQVGALRLLDIGNARSATIRQ